MQKKKKNFFQESLMTNTKYAITYDKTETSKHYTFFFAKQTSYWNVGDWLTQSNNRHDPSVVKMDHLKKKTVRGTYWPDSGQSTESLVYDLPTPTLEDKENVIILAVWIRWYLFSLFYQVITLQEQFNKLGEFANGHWLKQYQWPTYCHMNTEFQDLASFFVHPNPTKKGIGDISF